MIRYLGSSFGLRVYCSSNRLAAERFAAKYSGKVLKSSCSHMRYIYV